MTEGIRCALSGKVTKDRLLSIRKFGPVSCLVVCLLGLPATHGAQDVRHSETNQGAALANAQTVTSPWTRVKQEKEAVGMHRKQRRSEPPSEWKSIKSPGIRSPGVRHAGPAGLPPELKDLSGLKPERERDSVRGHVVEGAAAALGSSGHSSSSWSGNAPPLQTDVASASSLADEERRLRTAAVAVTSEPRTPDSGDWVPLHRVPRSAANDTASASPTSSAPAASSSSSTSTSWQGTLLFPVVADALLEAGRPGSGTWGSTLSLNVSEDCRHALADYVIAFDKMEAWAVRIYDSSGRPGPGMMVGGTTQYGTYDECLNTRRYPELQAPEPVTAKATRYCTALFRAPSWLTSYGNSLNRFYRPAHTPSVTVDLCVPGSCGVDDLVYILSTYVEGRGQNVTLQTVDCFTPPVFGNDTWAVVFVFVLAAILLLVLCGTCLDFLETVQKIEVVKGETSSLGFKDSTSRLSRFRASFVHHWRRLSSLTSSTWSDYKPDNHRRRNTIGYRPSLLRRFSSSILRRRPHSQSLGADVSKGGSDDDKRIAASFPPERLDDDDDDDDQAGLEDGQQKSNDGAMATDVADGVLLKSVMVRAPSVDSNFNAVKSSVSEDPTSVQPESRENSKPRRSSSSSSSSTSSGSGKRRGSGAVLSRAGDTVLQSLRRSGGKSGAAAAAAALVPDLGGIVAVSDKVGLTADAGEEDVHSDGHGVDNLAVIHTQDDVTGYAAGSEEEQHPSAESSVQTEVDEALDDSVFQSSSQQFGPSETGRKASVNMPFDDSFVPTTSAQRLRPNVTRSARSDSVVSNSSSASGNSSNDARDSPSFPFASQSIGDPELGIPRPETPEEHAELADALTALPRSRASSESSSDASRSSSPSSSRRARSSSPESDIIDRVRHGRKSSLRSNKASLPHPQLRVAFQEDVVINEGDVERQPEAGRRNSSPAAFRRRPSSTSSTTVSPLRWTSLDAEIPEAPEPGCEAAGNDVDELAANDVVGELRVEVGSGSSPRHQRPVSLSLDLSGLQSAECKMDDPENRSPESSGSSQGSDSPTSPTRRYIQNPRKDSHREGCSEWPDTRDNSPRYDRESSVTPSLTSIPEDDEANSNQNGTAVDQGKVNGTGSGGHQGGAHRRMSSRGDKYKMAAEDRWKESSDVEAVPREPAAHRSLWTEVLLCFSFLKAVRRIMAEGSADHLFSLNGVRVMSISWIVLGNTVSLLNANLSALGNHWDVLKHKQEFWFQAPINATFAADTFFILSGCLVTYNFLRGKTKELEKDPQAKVLTPNALLWFYIHRVFRIFPCFLVALLTCTVLLPHFGAGPRWASIHKAVQQCQDHWWANAFLFSNFYKADDMCMSWSYYLVNDLQFYLLSPLVLYPLLLKPYVGLMLLLLLVVVQMVCAGLITSGIHVHGGLLGMPSQFWASVYVKPYCRVGAFAIGMGLGYFLHSTERRIYFRKTPLLLGWLLSLAAVGGIVYVTFTEHGGDGGTAGWSDAQRGAFEAVSRPLWALVVSFIIFTCSVGQGGFVYRLLSWNAFLPLCRVTYGVYLLHPILIGVVLGGTRYPFYFQFGSLVYLYVANLTCAYGLAFLLITLVECPFTALEAVLHHRFAS